MKPKHCDCLIDLTNPTESIASPPVFPLWGIRWKNWLITGDSYSLGLAHWIPMVPHNIFFCLLICFCKLINWFRHLIGVKVEFLAVYLTSGGIAYCLIWRDIRCQLVSSFVMLISADDRCVGPFIHSQWPHGYHLKLSLLHLVELESCRDSCPVALIALEWSSNRKEAK